LAWVLVPLGRMVQWGPGSPRCSWALGHLGPCGPRSSCALGPVGHLPLGPFGPYDLAPKANVKAVILKNKQCDEILIEYEARWNPRDITAPPKDPCGSRKFSVAGECPGSVRRVSGECPVSVRAVSGRPARFGHFACEVLAFSLRGFG
jgi:hypothetical protein